MQPNAILDLVDPNWDAIKVLVIAFPVPPIFPVYTWDAGGSVIYPVDGWASDAIDDGIDLLSSENQHVALTGKMTPMGPAFLMQYHLDQLVNNNGSDYAGLEGFSLQTYCASTSFAVKYKKLDDVYYANRATLTGFTPISRSCHPGSHLVAPQAPRLTAFMQLGNTHVGDFMLTSPSEAELLFPDVDFSCNTRADELFQYLAQERDKRAVSHLSPEVAGVAAVFYANQDLKVRLGNRATPAIYVDRIRLRQSFASKFQP